MKPFGRCRGSAPNWATGTLSAWLAERAVQIVARLQIEPVLRRLTETAPQAQRHVRRHGAFALDDVRHPHGRNADGTGKFCLRNRHLLHQGRTIKETIEIARDVAKKLIESQAGPSGVTLPPARESFDYQLIVAS